MDIPGDTRAWPTSRCAIVRESLMVALFVSSGGSKGGLL